MQSEIRSDNNQLLIAVYQSSATVDFPTNDFSSTGGGMGSVYSASTGTYGDSTAAGDAAAAAINRYVDGALATVSFCVWCNTSLRYPRNVDLNAHFASHDKGYLTLHVLLCDAGSATSTLRTSGWLSSCTSLPQTASTRSFLCTTRSARWPCANYATSPPRWTSCST